MLASPGASDDAAEVAEVDIITRLTDAYTAKRKADRGHYSLDVSGHGRILNDIPNLKNSDPIRVGRHTTMQDIKNHFGGNWQAAKIHVKIADKPADHLRKELPNEAMQKLAGNAPDNPALLALAILGYKLVVMKQNASAANLPAPHIGALLIPMLFKHHEDPATTLNGIYQVLKLVHQHSEHLNISNQMLHGIATRHLAVEQASICQCFQTVRINPTLIHSNVCAHTHTHAGSTHTNMHASFVLVTDVRSEARSGRRPGSPCAEAERQSARRSEP